MREKVPGESNNFFNFMLWLLWVVLVTLVLGGMAYLFIGGSSLFRDVNTAPVVVYRQISDGTLALSGSILKPAECYRLEVSTTGDTKEQSLYFDLTEEPGCDVVSASALPETFFAEVRGDETTNIKIFVNSVEQEVIIR